MWRLALGDTESPPARHPAVAGRNPGLRVQGEHVAVEGGGFDQRSLVHPGMPVVARRSRWPDRSGIEKHGSPGRN